MNAMEQEIERQSKVITQLNNTLGLLLEKEEGSLTKAIRKLVDRDWETPT